MANGVLMKQEAPFGSKGIFIYSQHLHFDSSGTDLCIVNCNSLSSGLPIDCGEPSEKRLLNQSTYTVCNPSDGIRLGSVFTFDFTAYFCAASSHSQHSFPDKTTVWQPSFILTAATARRAAQLSYARAIAMQGGLSNNSSHLSIVTKGKFGMLGSLDIEWMHCPWSLTRWRLGLARMVRASKSATQFPRSCTDISDSRKNASLLRLPCSPTSNGNS